MGIVGNRICLPYCVAGRVQPSVCDSRGHPPCIHSSDRFFHCALLGANLRDRPHRRNSILARLRTGLKPRLRFRFGAVRLLPFCHHSFHRMALFSGYVFGLGAG